MSLFTSLSLCPIHQKDAQIRAVVALSAAATDRPGPRRPESAHRSDHDLQHEGRHGQLVQSRVRRAAHRRGKRDETYNNICSIYSTAAYRLFSVCVCVCSKGADIFKARVNIEVQWILEEATIAAIERNGGMVTTKFYDIMCVNAMADVAKFLSDGKPIPRNGTPPLNAIEYYTSAANRGYLADPDQVAIERLKLAQKYGYTLPPAEATCDDPLFAKRKDPRQIWHDLEPGSLVNLKDKTVIKPVDKRWLEFYKS